ncbi:DUF5642 family protein [Mycobacterium xenopi]|uniref:DUF5642 domain-containing protein n=1 Tax=Mycobacterium xenopi TaxID=1789 RepID=A0AAD1H254_MYCXE|nr:DUF5642 family protein [Mycobacterium xenopi]MDA3639416.1 DUF5642 family protein [Mycobacterium xenopi]MDA3658306.1 DUF5642 family protein [Mycobacterium xenopi]MDA3662061.1 DUF5642 family protein [Mycobacterium xenopi]SPX89076.1 putative secreted protein [Mycobacterium xenopi]BBU23431.1 hypothetical protein MYXE_32210 [Mycobacterium xenopi]
MTSLLAALGVSVLAGCGHPAESRSSGASAVQPPAASPARSAYDISRVERVKDDLPPGFAGEAEPSKTLSQQDIASSGITAFTGAQVDPPQCRAVLIPPHVEPSVGTQAAGVRGQGDQGNIYVVAMRLPQPVRASQPPAGCDRVSVSGSPKASGTAERIPAPNIAGITTTGAKLSVDAADDPDYVFTAALDDQTSVVVMGSTDAQLNPQGLLSDLLVKATSAVRGQ